MNPSLGILVLGMIATGCGPAANVKHAMERDHSIVAAVTNVNDTLQKKEDLRFRLLCAKTKQASLVEAATLDVTKGTPAQDLSFTLKEPQDVNSVCRVEIRALTKGVYASDYEFQVESDLFYSSTKGALVKNSDTKMQLSVAIYKVYRDLKEETKPVATELTFPAQATGKMALTLICGDKKYLAASTLTDTDKVYKAGFAILYQDLAMPLSCNKVSAVSDDGKATYELNFTEPLAVAKDKPVLIKGDMALVTPAAPKPATSDTAANAGGAGAGAGANGT